MQHVYIGIEMMLLKDHGVTHNSIVIQFTRLHKVQLTRQGTLGDENVPGRGAQVFHLLGV